MKIGLPVADCLRCEGLETEVCPQINAMGSLGEDTAPPGCAVGGVGERLTSSGWLRPSAGACPPRRQGHPPCAPPAPACRGGPCARGWRRHPAAHPPAPAGPRARRRRGPRHGCRPGDDDPRAGGGAPRVGGPAAHRPRAAPYSRGARVAPALRAGAVVLRPRSDGLTSRPPGGSQPPGLRQRGKNRRGRPLARGRAPPSPAYVVSWLSPGKQTRPAW